MEIDLSFLPDGESGNVKIDTLHVSEEDARNFNFRCALSYNFSRTIRPGTYKRLLIDGETMMSNTPAEIRDHSGFIRMATGRVFIGGLGLGMCIVPLLAKKDITEIVVMEISDDVIKLVSPYYTDPRIKIVKDDLLSYKPDSKYDFAWFDIWLSSSAESYEDMKRLMRRWGKWAKWKDAWCRKHARELYLEDRHHAKFMAILHKNSFGTLGEAIDMVDKCDNTIPVTVSEPIPAFAKDGVSLYDGT